jgi:hypothetical protein
MSMQLSKARSSSDFVAIGNLGVCKALDRSAWAARFRALSAECIKLSEVSPDGGVAMVIEPWLAAILGWPRRKRNCLFR